ncbi:ExbD/TolR family protein [Sorangium sp. So ce1097]|uniref:ExbD/TolR family protein n=1 Tax=Sorangium sp. So ce1097 TaxID=3133330 RepID=UPI003F621F96
MADPLDVPLSSAQRSKIRRLSQSKEPEAGEEAGELNVVPYLDIIMNILIFVLASVSVTFVSSIDTTPPSIGGGKVRSELSSKALNLSAFITSQGISLKTSSGNIATGCQDVGSGVTVPKTGNDSHDFPALTACAKRLKNARPEFKEETQVTITANPGIDYKTIIDVMDALRSDAGEELFPEVHFGVAR